MKDLQNKKISGSQKKYMQLFSDLFKNKNVIKLIEWHECKPPPRGHAGNTKYFFVAKSLHFKRTVFSQERFVKNFDFKEVAKIKNMPFFFYSSIHLERNLFISSYSTFETYPELS